ncbi:LysR family transcriptional regulator [Tranquillimonas rosea]|uniref:LysR family transcriptional regulator n=1 Tax=Tranquillimonas rosea TaxID=641238 RepID=UPI003BA8526A
MWMPGAVPALAREATKEDLNLTLSAVSAAVAALEAQRDLKLFDRLPRRVALIESDAVFLPRPGRWWRGPNPRRCYWGTWRRPRAAACACTQARRWQAIG